MELLSDVLQAIMNFLQGINTWYNTPLPYPDGPTWYAAARMVNFTSLAFFLMPAMISLFRHRPRLWQAWIVAPFLVGQLLYFAVKLIVTPANYPTGTYGLLFINIMAGSTVFGLSLMIRLLTEVTVENSLLSKRVNANRALIEALFAQRKVLALARLRNKSDAGPNTIVK